MPTAPESKRTVIVDASSPWTYGLPSGRGFAVDEGRRERADGGHLAQPPPCQVEAVAAQVAQQPAARVLDVEAPRVGRVPGEAGEVPQRQVVRAADVAVVDQLLDPLVGRHPAIGEGHHRDEPPRRGGPGHGLRLRRGEGDGLLAQHRQVALDGRHRDVVVGVVGRGDDHGVDQPGVEQLGPVGERVLDAPPVRRIERPLGVAPADGGDRPSGWSARAGRYMASAHQLVPTRPTRSIAGRRYRVRRGSPGAGRPGRRRRR